MYQEYLMNRSNNGTTPPEHILKVALEVWRQAGEQHFIPVTGRSMLPLLQADDRVLVAHGSTGIRRGDIVVFRQDGELIVHRVIGMYHRDGETIFVTKGDNRLHFDPPVSANEIVGRALAVQRAGRSRSLETPLWRFTGWLIAGSTLAWLKLYGWSRALKQSLWGPQPNRLTAWLRHRVLVCSSLALKVVQALFWRGKK